MDDNYRHQIDFLKKTGFLYKRERTQQYKEKQISDSEAEMIYSIKELFRKNSTNYYIIITPLYDQEKFNKTDLALLKNTFDGKLYDFSGQNKYTESEYNYPDKKHFLPYISKEIADSVLALKQ